MPHTFFKDDNRKDSVMRLAFIVFMIVTVTLLVVIVALMIREHLAGGTTGAFNELIRWLTTGSLGGFIAKVAQKYLERKNLPPAPSKGGDPAPPPATTPRAEPATSPHSNADQQPAAPIINHQSEIINPQSAFRSLPDRQLTRNFRLYELIEASPTGNISFITMNWENIHQFSHERARLLAEHLQWVRDQVNQRYQQQNGGTEIPLAITSAWRCLNWELQQGRTGNSQHTQSWAADIQPRTANPELAVRIIAELHQQWSSTTTGHQGGLAIKHPTRNTRGQIITLGFLHLDLGTTRRWTYT